MSERASSFWNHKEANKVDCYSGQVDVDNRLGDLGRRPRAPSNAFPLLKCYHNSHKQAEYRVQLAYCDIVELGSMQTRNTSRRMLRSDTAPERQALDGNRNSVENQRIDRLERNLEEVRDDVRAIAGNMNTTIVNMNSNLSGEITDLKQMMAGLVQSVSNLVTGLAQVQTVAEAAQRASNEARQRAAVPSSSFASPGVPPVSSSTIASPGVTHGTSSPMRVDQASRSLRPTQLSLRKMDVKPPIFDGEIDGIKLNSFVFQFESYFRQKGYDLIEHDDLLCQELNQCVHTNALVWYERYMTDETTSKLWSAVKLELSCEFMEPNFQDKLRNKLLTIKQTGGYSGYVGKFRELNRIVQVDSMTAMNLFLNGLSDLSMKREILRKKPRDLNTAIQEGFLEWDLKAKPATTSNSAPDHRNQSQGKGKDATGGSQTKKPPGSATPAAHKTGIRNQISNRSGQTATKCPNCKRGYHKEEDCWFKYPEKRPKSQSDTRSLNKKIFALLERMVVSNDGNSQQDDDSQASN